MLKKIIVFWGIITACTLLAQNIYFSKGDNNLLIDYIKSKGSGIIVFDASNIKQFWVDKSVAILKDHDDSFDVLLNKTTHGLESIPLKIQLVNVNETIDCKIEVISSNKDIAFSVLNNKKEVVSHSSYEDVFIDYTIVSSVLHLEDTPQLSFNLLFKSKTDSVLSIKAIILSFSKNTNSSFLSSPGKLLFSRNTINTSSKITEQNATSFSATGKKTEIFSSKKIIVNDNVFTVSATIKNIGDIATDVYIGYKIYTQSHIMLDPKNFPYKNNNQILRVVSFSNDRAKIIVDSYPEWTKNCFLALNAKEDLSDIPNTNLLNEKISEIRKFENGYAEIILSAPLKSPLEKGSSIRVHGQTGSFLYTNYKQLKPGEEIKFDSTIQKDDTFLQFSRNAFCKNVYYVIPLILSYSVDPSKESTIQISDCEITFSPLSVP